jgi:hypothetical protein
MRGVAAQSKASQRSSLGRSLISKDAVRWAVGIAIGLAAVALFITVAAFAPARVRANNDRCLRQFADDEHVSLEAFFQNPTRQEAVVGAVTACSR